LRSLWRIDRRGLWTRRGYARERLTPWRALLVWFSFPLILVTCLLLAANRRSRAGVELLASALTSAPADGQRAAKELAGSILVAGWNTIEAEPSRRESALPRVDLQVQRQALELLERAEVEGSSALGRQPGGDRPFVQGLYREDRGPWQVTKVGRRGLSDYHHLSEKPSFRIRIRKRDLRQSRRHVELLRPEDPLALCNVLPFGLARRVGLMSEPSEPVRVFVNGRPFGVYIRSERPTEALMISQGRLPGTIWKGDEAERAAAARGGRSQGSLFHSTELWKSEDDPVPGSMESLEDMITILRYGEDTWSQEQGESLKRVLDVEAYARYEAFNAIVGGVHTTLSHNHALFWNTYRGRLEPIPWDVNGYGFMAGPRLTPNVCQTPITSRLYSDPRWVHRRDEILWDLLRGEAREELELEALRAHVSRVLPALREDPLTSRGIGRVDLVPLSELEAEVKEVEAWIKERHTFLRQYLGFAIAHVGPSAERPGWSEVSVDGAIALRVGGGPQQGRLLYPGMSYELRGAKASSSAFTLTYTLVPVPRRYLVQGDPGVLALANAVTGGSVLLAPRPRPGEKSRSFRPEPPPEVPGEIQLGPGVVDLRESLDIRADQVLRIHSGTIVRLHSGVGIYSRGKVLAQGSAADPIRLESAGKEPWACVGLYGPGTRGSRFEHVSIAGGSVGSDGSRRFLGMLSAYFCPDLELTRCHFGGNRVGDDAVNLAQTQVQIRACTWKGSRSDGLDLDRCVARIEDSDFINCGNDGLDLSHGTAWVRGGRFSGCSDKGVSAGEGTRVLLEGVQVEGCRYGVQSKDASAVILRDCELVRNQVGVHAYRKKPMFRLGGLLLLRSSRIDQSQVADVSIDQLSGAFLSEGSVAPRLGHGAERVHQSAAVSPVWDQIERAIRAKFQ